MAAILVAGFGVSSVLPAVAQTAAPAKSIEDETKDKITIASIKDTTAALTDPAMEGRGTGQPGGEKAANWIADKFRSLGLKPLGDKGSYLQKVSFTETVIDPDSAMLVGDEQMKRGEDYAVSPQTGNRSASASLVYVGYGIQSHEAGIDQIGSVDISGKFVVMIAGPPPGYPKDVWEKQKAQRVIMSSLFQKRPAGFIFFSRGDEDQTEDQAVDYYTRRRLTLSDERSGDRSDFPVFISMTEKGISKIFEKAGMTRDEALKLSIDKSFKGKELKIKSKVTSKVNTTKAYGYNVAGVLEGSDPKLAAEAVIFSAHYDAYGKDNGKIYFGAADNALGTAEMISVAEAYSKLSQKPKRSLVFLAVTGEEYGLYGSKYWAKNPTWEVKKIAADLNLDGIGSEVYGPVRTMVGYGAEHSTIGPMLDDVAKDYGVSVIPDPMPEEKVFMRSDHYSFVQRGIPSLMLLGAPAGQKEVWMKRIKDWEKTDYHQPGDTIKDNWAWEGPETVAEIMAILGWRISESPEMPSWLKTSRFSKYDRGNNKEIPEDDQ